MQLDADCPAITVTGIAVVLVLSPVAPVSAAPTDSAGRTVAEDHCTACHQLPDGEGQPVAPSFSELAGRAHYSASDLADIMDDPQHMGAIAAKDLSLDALASYLNQIDR